MSTQTFTIKPLALEDVPLIAKISAEAFEHDRQTIMKGLGSAPFFMEEHTLNDLPNAFKNPRVVLLKAVDNETGETMGYIKWVFVGFSQDQLPVVEGRVVAPAEPPQPAAAATTTQPTEPVAESRNEPAEETEAEKARKENPIQRLIALQNNDMNEWIGEIMPKGVRCLLIGGLQVAPKWQGRGAGSALIRFGTNFCDQHGVFAWVHSSESAWKMYEKTGFQVSRVLDCDLDEYSPMPPPDEGPDAKWGHYVLRYMRYFPPSYNHSDV